ncbi:MAG: methyltransferase domain-containing protein [Deltaproteobacteria bacterium]|nr:methyltransferase domain-containing protein [Deltaproteobacteria bacterium]
MSDDRFRIYPQFNEPSRREFARMKHRVHSLPADLFPTDSLPDRLARSLAEHRVVHIKELLESFEFYYRVRRRVRRPTIVELCAGHGLVGLIFALCDRSVTRVELVDSRQPATYSRIREAVTSIGPWVADKVSYREVSLDESTELPEGAGVVLAHACGALTDLGLDCAIAAGAPVAAMPCCYGKARGPRVPTMTQVFGRAANIDITRSHRLAEAGYQVDWTHIPRAITPMNRILIGWDRR